MSIIFQFTKHLCYHSGCFPFPNVVYSMSRRRCSPCSWCGLVISSPCVCVPNAVADHINAMAYVTVIQFYSILALNIERSGRVQILFLPFTVSNHLCFDSINLLLELRHLHAFNILQGNGKEPNLDGHFVVCFGKYLSFWFNYLLYQFLSVHSWHYWHLCNIGHSIVNFDLNCVFLLVQLSQPTWFSLCLLVRVHMLQQSCY